MTAHAERRRAVSSRPWAALLGLLLLAGTLIPMGLSLATAPPRSAGARIAVVAAENAYGSVAAQVGGRYVAVTSVMDNPNTDPHSFELSASVASAVATARLVIQNGLGYDGFMNRIEQATAGTGRRVLTVGHLLRVPAHTFNPHLWYAPGTMPAVARAVGDDLAAFDPGHAGYFRANVARFDASLRPWLTAIARFRAHHSGTAVSTTEPVADDLLAAMGLANTTPVRFQTAVMNGTDPSPQDLATVRGLVARRRVHLLVYNEQVADPLTSSLRTDAISNGLPVVAVYETMPTPGWDYQRWMLAETGAIARAVERGTSTMGL